MAGEKDTGNYLYSPEILNPTFNTGFSTTEYPFRILYLPTQIQMILCIENPVFLQSIEFYGALRRYNLSMP